MFRTCCLSLVLLASAALGAPSNEVERQVASQRRLQIESLKKIIALSQGGPELPGLMFNLGELYREEARFLEHEADGSPEQAGQLAKAKEYRQSAVKQYTQIVQQYPDFERSDEVLFFLGQFLTESGEERKALVAYERLVKKYPKSRFVPDAWVAFGEYLFNSSKGKREQVERALEAYKRAAEFTDSPVYAFAIYKQGWCYFNMADYSTAKDKFKLVVLFGELAGARAEGKDGGNGRAALVREARKDYVRAYSRGGDVMQARDDFAKVAAQPEDRFTMMKQLANLYYEDGKDREAAITFNQLIKEKPLSPESPGFQAKIVDCVRRMGNKERTVEQVRRLVKLIKEVEASGTVKEEKDKKLLDEANEQAEGVLSNLAITWHNEGQKTHDEETLKHADAVSGDYLTLFPNGSKAPEIRRLRAGLSGQPSGEPEATPQTPLPPGPSEKEGEQSFTTAGMLDRDAIRAVIGSHKQDLAGCYEAVLTQHPTLEGKVVVKFVIDKEGSTASAAISESTVRDEAMESCIVKHVKSWSWPKPRGGGVVIVNYPFFFRPAPNDGEPHH